MLSKRNKDDRRYIPTRASCAVSFGAVPAEVSKLITRALPHEVIYDE